MYQKIRRLIIDMVKPQRIIRRRIQGVDLNLLRIGDMSEAMIEKALTEEPYTIHWILNMPKGSVLYDIGANMGIYSILAALTGKIVYAFEPMPYNLHLLYRNMQINHISKDRLYPVPVALGFGDHLQWQTVTPMRDAPGAANIYAGDEASGIIPTIGLDFISRQFFRPDYVKIDVDGPESDIILGGWNTLRKAKEIQIERRPGCREMMTQLGFGEAINFNFYKNHLDDRYENLSWKEKVNV